MVDLIKYTGLTGLSGSIFSLVDITGLFLFYDITYCLELMNKMRWNLIKYIQFDGFINDVMFYFYLVAVMVGITGLTGFSYFRKMMS